MVQKIAKHINEGKPLFIGGKGVQGSPEGLEYLPQVLHRTLHTKAALKWVPIWMVLGCYFLSIKCSYLKAFLVGLSTPKRGFQNKTPKACPQAFGNRRLHLTTTTRSQVLVWRKSCQHTSNFTHQSCPEMGSNMDGFGVSFPINIMFLPKGISGGAQHSETGAPKQGPQSMPPSLWQ